MPVLIRRSYLFVPGNRPDRFAKACAAGADAVIVDLEDAVPPAEKIAARASIQAWLSPAHPVLIRVNGVESEWFHDDVTLCGEPGVAGIVLPKAERADDIRFLAGKAHSATTSILPLIETGKGFWNASELARTGLVQRLVFGSIDLQLDLGMSVDEEELLYFRSQLVLISHITDLQPPIDGVTTAIDSTAQVRSDTLRAKRLGFGAKLCIHPSQIHLVNECFRPTPEDEAWARRVTEAAAVANGSVVAVDGKMVDRPILARAEAILADLDRPLESGE
jgi:citrate lyase subunit beta / citryl-CoA lyase